MFLPTVLEQTVEAETPKQFFFWSALTAIAAVLKRNVYFDRYNFKVYPNIYVILIAKSGLRKGLAPAMAAKIVEGVNNTRVIEGRSSIQKLISDLASAWIPEGQTQPVTDSCGFIVSPELAAAMIEDPQAMTIMTDLYDSQYHNKWKNRLKGTGLEVLENPTITWLAASNEQLLKEIITIKELHGGFIGRTFLVTADKRNTINSLVNKPERSLDYSVLIPLLKEISKLSGPFTLDDEAKENFDLWYKKVASTATEDTTGTYDRLDSHVLKLSMLIQAGRYCNQIITADTIQEAIDLCRPMVQSAKATAGGRGQNPLGEVAMVVIKELILKPEIGRMELLRKLWKDVGAHEFDQIYDTLFQAGAIESINHEGKVFYRLTGEFRKSLGKDE